MTLFYMYLEQEYKGIKKGGYYFNNRFNIFPKIEEKLKTIILEDNDDYLDLFNSSINSVSCIVGKNGAGKTTFIELLITNLIWGLEEKALDAGKMTLFFFKETSSDITFHLQSYRDYGRTWEIQYKQKPQIINRTESYEINPYHGMAPGEKKWHVNTKFPYEVNILFHSLSPFDRINTLLKEKLITSDEQKNNYYDPCFRYIGVNKIEVNEYPYEYQSINNLLSSFFDNKYKKILLELGYDFKKIEITLIQKLPNINFNKTHLFELLKNIEKPIEKYEDEAKFINFFNKYIYEKYETLFPFGIYSISDSFDLLIFQKVLFLSSITLSEQEELTSFILNFKDTPNLESVKKDYNSFVNFIDSLQLDNPLFDENRRFYISYKNHFLQFVKYNLSIEILKDIQDFNDYTISSKENKKDIYKILKNIKKFTTHNILNFELIINKLNINQEIDYFRLSSGEKTFLTMFCNLSAKINDIKEYQNSDAFKSTKRYERDYSNITEKAFYIILDEVELHLHPEWQRKFILLLNQYFKADTENEKYQFFIATHSPFVVSDLDANQIIYLGHEKNVKNTFGGNIFDIFKRDFYVKNSIGAFSEKIIKELSECLYFLFICKSAYDGNFFPLRDYIDEPYKDRTKKANENRLLKRRLYLFLNRNRDRKNYFTNIIGNPFFENYCSSKDDFLKKSKIIVNKIGDEVIRIHLKNLLEKIEFFEVEKYE